MRAAQAVAGFDTAAVMLHALARFLRGRDFPDLGRPRELPTLVRASALLPRPWRQRLYAWALASEALDPKSLDRVDSEAVAAWMARLYPRRRNPVVAIGAASGAVMHLCAALGAPWLPQTWQVPVRLRCDPDDPAAALAAGVEPGRRLLAANPDLVLHHLHDPVRDRLWLGQRARFQVKRTRLPAAWRRFLADRLTPGGTILMIECTGRWPTTRLDGRHVFQFGAPGGPGGPELFRGSPLQPEYLARMGARRGGWDPPPTDGDSPEAEWGFAPELADDVADFAERRGFRLVRMRFDDPADPSPLVADLYRGWHARRWLGANRLLVESYILVEPYLALRLGAVPFWLAFNGLTDAARLEAYLDRAPPFDWIDLTLFANGSDGIGQASIARWRQLLVRARRKGAFAGVDEGEYPNHFSVFARYAEALEDIPARHPLPGPLTLGEVAEFLIATGGRYPVAVEGPGTRVPAWKPPVSAPGPSIH